MNDEKISIIYSYCLFMGWLYIILLAASLFLFLAPALFLSIMVFYYWGILLTLILPFYFNWVFPITSISAIIILFISIMTKEISFRKNLFKFKSDNNEDIVIFYICCFLFYLFCCIFTHFKIMELGEVHWQFCIIFAIIFSILFYCIKKHCWIISLFSLLLLCFILINPSVTDVSNSIKKMNLEKYEVNNIRVYFPNYFYFSINEKKVFKIDKDKYLIFGISKKIRTKHSISYLPITVAEFNAKTFKLNDLKVDIENNYFIYPIKQLPDGNILILLKLKKDDGKRYIAVFDVKTYNIKDIEYEKDFKDYDSLINLDNDILFFKESELIFSPDKTKSRKYYKTIIYNYETKQCNENFVYKSMSRAENIAIGDNVISFTDNFENGKRKGEIIKCNINNHSCKNIIFDNILFYNSMLFKNSNGQIILFNKSETDKHIVDVLIYNSDNDSCKKILEIPFEKCNDSIEYRKFIQLSNGNIIITDSSNGKIMLYDISTNKIKELETKIQVKVDEYSAILLEDNKLMIVGLNNKAEILFLN